MPRFKGSCGCYNREDARRYGLATAVVWNDILDRAEHFDTNPMWYDQQQAADRLGIPRQTVNRAVKILQVNGRLKAKVGYRPNSRVTTTWIEILTEQTEMDGEWIVEAAKDAKELGDILDAQNEHPKDAQNEHPILNDTKEKRLTVDVVKVEKWDFNSKGIWKRKRTVYTTVDEADKIEGANKDEYVTFDFWPSPILVGREDKAKSMSEKKTKLKTEYPEEPEEEGGKKTGGYMEGIGW